MTDTGVASCARRVLVTGGAGEIGRAFVDRYRDEYELTVLDLPGAWSREIEGIRIVEADIRNLEALKPAFAGIDTVVHLAARRQPSAVWADVLEINIVGTYNVVAAAVASGCRRVLFASSVHAVSGYPRGLQVREDDPINPGNLYGVSKCFGEALGRYAAEQEGLSFIALRIGAFDPTVTASDVGRGWTLEEYCAPGDLIELIKLCVDDERICFEIFNATSDNRFNRLDVTKARRLLGYKPVFDAFAMVPAVREALGAADPGAWRELSGMGGEVGMDELGES